MKKIGIITFHKALNYGAILQSFSLQNTIKKMGYDCEIINYECEKLSKDDKCFNIFDNSIKSIILAFIKFPINFIKKSKFNKFRKNINISKKRYNRSNILESNLEYSCFIAGSDQIWNLNLTNYDYTYFLDFVDTGKLKNTYAASLGNYDDYLDNKIMINNLLKNFNNISFRENDGVKFFKDNFGIDSKCVLDPVFLTSSSDWIKLASKKRFNNYILVYTLHEKNAFYVAEKISKLTNKKIICISMGLKKPIKAKYLHIAGIEEFISLIYNADYVVTDSFHGAAFSIIFNKNLKLVLKNEYQYLNSRLNNLIRIFDINNCIVDLNTSENMLISILDYKKTNIKLKKAYLESNKYLINILEDVNEQ